MLILKEDGRKQRSIRKRDTCSKPEFPNSTHPVARCAWHVSGVLVPFDVQRTGHHCKGPLYGTSVQVPLEHRGKRPGADASLMDAIHWSVSIRGPLGRTVTAS